MIAGEYDAFFLDLDGVVYVGEVPTEGAVSALDCLRNMDKDIRFLTNNPTTREEIVRRLAVMGIKVDKEEVITSGTATASVLAERGVKQAWVLGHEGLKKTLAEKGIASVKGRPCEAVVVGWDDGITLGELREAALAIYQGALFVATNEDWTYPGPEGPLSGVGIVVEALVAGSGVRPISVGKPWTPMFDQAMKTLKPGQNAVMIGDTPEADILGAHRAGLDAVLMGNATPFPGYTDFRNPDGVISRLGDLFDPARLMKKWCLPSYPWPESVEPGVAGVVLNDQGEVLLIRRADNGLWGIPSGHVEPGETVETAVVREVKEETGLEVEVSELVGVYSDPCSQVITYPDSRVCHFVTSCFNCRVRGGSLVKAGPETLDAGFFSFGSLPEPLMSMHPRWLADSIAREGRPFVR